MELLNQAKEQPRESQSQENWSDENKLTTLTATLS